ncbi:hypothetical protein NX059_006347 [Plenodomus lindquistii]|nr:hypothetical protein NX059_006347 [Plenodomus lindquistii]
MMAAFSEAIGNLALEYMLVASTVRLAQCKGLHLKVSESSKLSEQEICTRYAYWWTIYVYDKQLALRSGRPSTIDDTSITCPLRYKPPPGTEARMEMTWSTARFFQITSVVLKRLSTSKLKRKSPAKIMVIARALDEQLREWYDSLAPALKKWSSATSKTLSPGLHPAHVNFFRSHYNSCLILIHTPFCSPWLISDYAASQDAELALQKEKSTAIVAAAARDIIITMQGLRISTEINVCLTTFLPLVGLINLFLHVVQYPRLPSAESDLSLLDAVVGHFGYLDFLSGSELGTQTPRKIASYAREVVRRAKNEAARNDTDFDIAPASESFDIDATLPLFEAVGGDWTDFGFDDWGAMGFDVN